MVQEALVKKKNRWAVMPHNAFKHKALSRLRVLTAERNCTPRVASRYVSV